MSEPQQEIQNASQLPSARTQNQGESSKPKLLVLVGATATGKSALALALAERLGGELICADSRTIYRGMDIGTAKPSVQDLAQIPHYGLDLVEPGEPFTVADFKAYAEQKIADIAGRGKLPIMVGGSGLYIDAVIYDYQFRPPANPELRAELEGFTIEELQEKVVTLGYDMPTNERNPRHLMRTIEAGGLAGQADRQSGLRPNTCVIGLDLEIEELVQRIAARVGRMINDGLVDEVSALAEQYGWDIQAMQSPGYKEFRRYLAGEQDLDEARAEVIKSTRALAKRQKTWFRRNKSIHWLTTEDKLAEAVDIITTDLDT